LATPLAGSMSVREFFGDERLKGEPMSTKRTKPLWMRIRDARLPPDVTQAQLEAMSHDELRARINACRAAGQNREADAFEYELWRDRTPMPD
jgi:hypothetical protein